MTTTTLDTPPDAGSYGRVLRRPGLDLSQALNTRFVGYDCVVKARAVQHHDGRPAVTLFFPTGFDNAADRAAKLGWEDVTEAYARWRAESDGPPARESLMDADWSDVVALARRRGTKQSGTREEVVDALLDSWE